MKKASKLQHKNDWILVASQEFQDLVRHYEFGTSVSGVARELGCNYKTIKKLNPNNPNPTLRITTYFKLLNTVHCVVYYKSPLNKLKSEMEYYSESLIRVMSKTFKVPNRVKEDLISSGYMNPDGSRAGLVG